MNISGALITMPVDEAKRKLRAFRANKHKDAEQLYRAAALGYEALAKGTPLIQLSRAIQGGGFDDQERPRLAIARADRPEVCFRWSGYVNNANFDTGKTRNYDSLTLKISVDMGRQHRLRRQLPDNSSYAPDIRAYTLVPMVPADVRPATGQLRDWHILWEVEKWYSQPKHMSAPTDPYLLKHVVDDLWAVVAQWDLTPLERAVLEARAAI